MNYFILRLTYLSILLFLFSCKENTLKQEMPVNTDIVDTFIQNQNDTILPDSMPTKIPQSNDSINTIPPKSNDKMPIVIPKTP